MIADGAVDADATAASRIVLLDNDAWPDYARRDVASIAAERGQPMVIIHAYTEGLQREAIRPSPLRPWS